jgi:hypothetical protein
MRMVYSVQCESLCAWCGHREEIEGVTGIIEGMLRSCGSWAYIHARAERQLLLEAAEPFV